MCDLLICLPYSLCHQSEEINIFQNKTLSNLLMIYLINGFRLIYIPTIVANSSDAELAAVAALSAAFISFKMVSYAPAALSVSPAGSLV